MLILSCIALVITLWKIHLLHLKIWELTQQRDKARATVNDLTVALRGKSDSEHETLMAVSASKVASTESKPKRPMTMAAKRSVRKYGLTVKNPMVA